MGTKIVGTEAWANSTIVLFMAIVGIHQANVANANP